MCQHKAPKIREMLWYFSNVRSCFRPGWEKLSDFWVRWLLSEKKWIEATGAGKIRMCLKINYVKGEQNVNPKPRQGWAFQIFSPKIFLKQCMRHLRYVGPMERHWDSDFLIFRSISLKRYSMYKKKSYKALSERSQTFVMVSLCFLFVWAHLLFVWVLICLVIGLDFWMGVFLALTGSWTHII